MFDTVLIANRGEIALRVARTCREMGIRTVAVCSTADRASAVTAVADETVIIGPPASRHSYQYIPAIIEAALATSADAVHPGYGFLSEDPDFAEICAANGLTFVGPSPETMEMLGDKAVARTMMAKAGLPVLPGSEGALDSANEAKEIANSIGYPVVVKAAAGGGGRGIAVVHDPKDFLRTFRATQAAARSLFGDGSLYVERFVAGARHVEVQVLLDRHGRGVHLGERDCSIQRRHQKLVEETPAPGIDPALTAEMCAVAVEAAASVGYEGLGTFEFLVDDSGYSFIEVNCRIQVEHPVTEMVTGIDLVREQLLVASGAPLRLSQESVVRRGHAVECRVNTEDPSAGYSPTAGLLTAFRPPGGPFTRVDTHGFAGWQVPPDYDSLLAKVITWGEDRGTALARMDRALGEFRIEGAGVRTTIGILRTVLADPRYRAATHRLSFLEELEATR